MSAAVLRSSARGSQTTGSVQRERKREKLDRGGTRREGKKEEAKWRRKRGICSSETVEERERGGREIEIKRECASPMNCVLWKRVSCM